MPPGPPVLQTLVAEIYGPDESSRLALAKAVRDVFLKTDGVVDVDGSVEADQPKTRLVVDKEKAALLGISTETISDTVRLATDGLTVDLAAHRVTLRGDAVRLTPTEFKLLARLVRSAGQVVTHRQLLADVWGEEFTEHTHYLRLYMGQLRAKLEADPADPQRLLTEPGVGYRLTEPAG